MTDSEILQELIDGNDQKVIDSLYFDVFPNVKKYIVNNNGSTHEAEDCFQEAITKFYRQVLKNEFNAKYKVHGYIYSISIRLWLNTIKRDKRKVSLNEIEEDYLNISISDERNEIVEDKNELITTILNQLGERCKELLYHSIYSDLINEDLMLRFGYASVAAVKMQHKRCKQKMIELFKKSPELETALRA